MSPRLLCLALLPLVPVAGCGEGAAAGEARFGVELLVDQAVASQLSAFQIAVLPDGRQRDCAELQKRCLRQQVRASELLVLRDAKGSEGRALRYPVELSGTEVLVQEVSIEVPVGRDYALIIEGLSGDSPPRFLGSSCNLLPEVNAGRNEPVLAAPMTITSADCDPTL